MNRTTPILIMALVMGVCVAVFEAGKATWYAVKPVFVWMGWL